VTGEIVRNSLTLVVAGVLSQFKNGESLSPLGLAFGVWNDFPPVGPTLSGMGQQVGVVPPKKLLDEGYTPFKILATQI
jgi:hypothetical protein